MTSDLTSAGGLARFLARPAATVAPELLGWTLRHGPVAIRLTEVEAYQGAADPGSHAYRGPTPRTAVMFGPAGHWYSYFSYGAHWCLNVVCDADGTAAAVLLRAGEVVEGRDVVAARRPGIKERDWARGPGRLMKALGIHENISGSTAWAGSDLTLEPGPPPASVATGPRVGVSGEGGDGERFPWRFWADGDPTVSGYRPGAGGRSTRRAPAGKVNPVAAGIADEAGLGQSGPVGAAGTKETRR